MKKINLGFIGAGFIAQQCHLPAFKEQNNCNIFGVADLHRDLASRVANIYEIPNIYSSHKDLLLNGEIDAVVVTLPRAYTYGVVRDCLIAGKHVLTEKPLSLNFENAKKLKSLAKKQNLLLQVGYMKRNDSGLKKFKELVEENFNQNNIPLLVKSSCFMGDSYCSPFGSIKSKEEPLSSELFLENFPSFLSEKESVGYENFVNTYSHVLDSLGFIFDHSLQLITSNISDDGFGITLFDLNNSPTEISTAKVHLNNWFEEIKIVYEHEILTISLPPALLKNVPATIKIQKGKDFYEEITLRPKWSWSFLNQAQDFISKIQKNDLNFNSLDSAIESLYLSYTIFKNRS
ncbi:Gfo/Idh/MocA family oxidoreductase [Candidatus Thioglobus sp.]|nr:Gfo/Idh/MocA family oxidoreductase [Candidatus Thioglobus sp.]